MGKMHTIKIKIPVYELFEKIEKACFPDKKQQDVNVKFIDYAYLFGIRDKLSPKDKKRRFTEAEFEQVQKILKYRPIRNGYVENVYWEDGCADIQFHGWNACPHGLAHYFSTLYPDVEFEVVEFDHEGWYSDSYTIKDGLASNRNYEYYDPYEEEYEEDEEDDGEEDFVDFEELAKILGE